MTDRSTQPPTLARLGEEIRLAREAIGLTQAQLGKKVSYSVSLLSMIETAQRAPRLDLVEMLDHVLGTDGRLAQLWRKRATWPQVRLAPLLEAENRATVIREYHPVLVPGLLQTEAYARALMSNALFASADSAEIRHHVARRIDRQSILRDGSRRYHAVLDESVLNRVIGDDRILCGQLDHLLEMTSRYDVTVQIMPMRAGSYPATGPLSVFDTEDGAVVHLEVPVGVGRTTTDAGTVGSCIEQFDLLLSQSTSPDESQEMVRRRRMELQQSM